MRKSTLRSGKIESAGPEVNRASLERRSPAFDWRETPTARDIVLLGALCLFLSALDHLIPKPLPFMRLGLANLPLLIAVDIFSARQFFLLALIKVLGQGLVTGTLFSYVALFSLAGTALSAAVMFLLRRGIKNIPALAEHKHCISLIGTSIAGAFVSNAVQLVLARFIVFGEGIRYLAPPFLAAGIISGGLLGFFAEAFSTQSEWLKRKRLCLAKPLFGREPGFFKATLTNNPCPVKNLRGRLWNLVLLFLAIFFLVIPDLPVRAVLFLFFWALAFAMRKKTRPLFVLIGIIMITVCNLFPPFGKILFTIGPFIIAKGSLTRGLQRAVTMEGLIMFSALALGSIPPLPGKIGRLLQETFGILEQLNKAWFGKDAADLNIQNEKKKTGMFPHVRLVLQKLDRLLCELS